MKTILHFETIDQYDTYIATATLHPLINVINLSEVKPMPLARKSYGFYYIILKDTVCGDLRYGQDRYDYQEGTLVFLAPGQIAGDDDNGSLVQWKGWGLCFHPDLLRGTLLSQKMKNYSFFSYETNESLHMSDRERQIILNCFHEMKEELTHSIDKHSKFIVTANLEVLLNHCLRFYDRQFVTRNNLNKDTLCNFEQLLNQYFESDQPQTIGLPYVQYFAEQLKLSANYFGDLIKKETGKSAQEYIQTKLINTAKNKLHHQEKTVSEIAYEMGFKYPHHFSRMFKKIVGTSPSNYRNSKL